MRRSSILLLAVIALAALVGRTGADARPVADLTRVRLELQTTSSWAGVRLDDASVIARHTVSQTPAAVVRHGAQGFSIEGTPPVSAVVDVVLRVPSGARPTVVLRKGWDGEGTLSVTRTNDQPATIAQVHNDRRTGDYTVTHPVAATELLGSGLELPRADDRRLVLAFYYPWFSEDSFNRGRWPDRPAERYATDDPEHVRAMVSRASEGGVNGFVVSWSGRDRDAAGFDLVLDAANEHGFTAAPLVELLHTDDQAVPREETLRRSVERALERAGHPAFLHVDGRPVLFVFGAREVPAQRWNVTLAEIERSGVRPFVVGDSLDETLGFEGFYYYNPNKHDEPALHSAYQSALARTRIDPTVDPGVEARLWAATVSPGFNTLARQPLTGWMRPRQGGERYDMSWRVALASTPEWVLVTSWNEWYEATHIAPGDQTGSTALWQTRSWANHLRVAP